MTKCDRHIFSLNAKLIIVVIASAVLSGLIFFVLMIYCNSIITKKYMSDENIYMRQIANYNSLSDYINQNKVTSRDSKKISSWAVETGYTDVIVFDDNYNILVEIDWYGSGVINSSTDNNYNVIDSLDDASKTPVENTNISNLSDVSLINYNNSMYLSDLHSEKISFFDGDFNVCILDCSYEKIQRIYTIFSFCISAVLFLTIILIYSTYITKRIIELEKDVKLVEKEDFNQSISIKGNDELSCLASDIDSMRKTILDRLINEQNAWDSNKELVTSMAHDIRNPLTVLSGYLNLLKQKQYSDINEQEHFLEIAVEKTEQLQDLSNKLFEYFYVFGKSTNDINLENINASVLLQQFIGEHVLFLKDKGFKFEINMLNEDIDICVDIQRIKRIFDNIFGNILKYADIKSAVQISVLKNDGFITVFIKNKICTSCNQVQSTNIGLLTCRKICEETSCKFEIKKTENTFAVVFSIPIWELGDKK